MTDFVGSPTEALHSLRHGWGLCGGKVWGEWEKEREGEWESFVIIVLSYLSMSI